MGIYETHAVYKMTTTRLQHAPYHTEGHVELLYLHDVNFH